MSRPIAYRCTICESLIEGDMVGDGDGSGQKFAHPLCYWKREAESVRANAAYAEQLQQVIRELIACSENHEANAYDGATTRSKARAVLAKNPVASSAPADLAPVSTNGALTPRDEPSDTHPPGVGVAGPTPLNIEMHKALEFYANRKNWNPVADYADGYWYIAGQPWMQAFAALKNAGLDVDALAEPTIADPLDTGEAQARDEPLTGEKLALRIRAVLMAHRLQHTLADDESGGHRLVDALTMPFDETIKTGIDEIDILAEEIACHLDDARVENCSQPQCVEDRRMREVWADQATRNADAMGKLRARGDAFLGLLYEAKIEANKRVSHFALPVEFVGRIEEAIKAHPSVGSPEEGR